MSSHEIFIRQAIALAAAAKAGGNHPFGALLVGEDGQVLLTAENTVVTGRNPTHHAELNLVNVAWKSLTKEQIATSTLYTSCEPCPMCTGSIFWSDIRTVVYSLPASTLGELANDKFCDPCTSLFDRADRKITVIGPILPEEGVVDHVGFWDSL
jgi:tRNA(Arg) A34 adenosine deaminase TadA